MVCWNVLDASHHMACKELDHIFAHNTNVYVCHLCIKNSYSIKFFLNDNSGDPVVALLNNLALLSKGEVRSFTLLTLSPKKKKKKIEKFNFCDSSNSFNFKHE